MGNRRSLRVAARVTARVASRVAASWVTERVSERVTAKASGPIATPSSAFDALTSEIKYRRPLINSEGEAGKARGKASSRSGSESKFSFQRKRLIVPSISSVSYVLF